jgi:phage protein D
VNVGGTKFDEYSEKVSDVVVDTTTDGADHFSITLTYPFDHEQVSFEELKWSTFEPGKSVEISFGYGESTTKVFTGSIETVEPEFTTNEPPKVIVTGYSALRKMMKGTNSKSWKKKSVGKIAKSVASKSLKSVKTKKASAKLQRVFQDDQSDYQFVTQLANKYGFEFFASMGEGQFRPRSEGASSDPVAELYYGESLESFTAEMRPPNHGEVEVRYWDEKKKKTIKGSAKNKKGSGKRVYRVPVESKSEAKDIAKSKLEALRVEGTAETFGIPSIVAGKVVKLKGLGSKFTKNYYVTQATHRMGDTGYRMSFEVTRLDE